MRCIHAPEEKLELVRCCMQRKAGFGEQGFDFQFSDNQNLGRSFEKLKIYTKKPKISHFLWPLWLHHKFLKRNPGYNMSRMCATQSKSYA